MRRLRHFDQRIGRLLDATNAAYGTVGHARLGKVAKVDGVRQAEVGLFQVERLFSLRLVKY